VSKPTHPAEVYVDDILSGKIVANQYIRWACERHRNDLARVGKPGFPYHHDPERAQRVIDFAAAFCRHVEGEWAGEPIIFSPADQFMIWVVFGWVCDVPDPSGLRPRRFREVYEEKARKQGKTTKLSALGLYLLDADGEEGARVYCAATKLDQARLLHRIAAQMVRKSPSLRKYVQVHKDNLHVEDTFSRFEPLGQDSDTLDGLNPSAALVDEYHKHKTNEVKNVLSTGMGARRQPLLWTITTAGNARRGPCWDLRTYAMQVLRSAVDGECINDRFAVFIYCLDEQDDPFEEKNWAKANPNLGISVKLEDMRNEASKAKYQPGERTKFLQKRLGFWAGEIDSWIPEAAWDACKVKPFTVADLVERSKRGRVKCWIGFDLSMKKDMTAVVQMIQCNGRLYLIPHYFLPRSALEDGPNFELYRAWEKAKLLTVTPGNVVKYKIVRNYVRDLRRENRRCEIVEVAGDAWNAKEFMEDLEDSGFSVWAIRQIPSHIAEPAKEFEYLVADKKIAHDGNPVLAWNLSNVRVRRDSNNNPYPDKQKSAGKIDGLSATINAVARWMFRNTDDATKNAHRVVGFKLETL
jgi:phage terminase large subunit-like protein